MIHEGGEPLEPRRRPEQRLVVDHPPPVVSSRPGRAWLHSPYSLRIALVCVNANGADALIFLTRMTRHPARSRHEREFLRYLQPLQMRLRPRIEYIVHLLRVFVRGVRQSSWIVGHWILSILRLEP
jgi:hypothetical protein